MKNTPALVAPPAPSWPDAKPPPGVKAAEKHATSFASSRWPLPRRKPVAGRPRARRRCSRRARSGRVRARDASRRASRAASSCSGCCAPGSSTDPVQAGVAARRGAGVRGRRVLIDRRRSTCRCSSGSACTAAAVKVDAACWVVWDLVARGGDSRAGEGRERQARLLRRFVVVSTWCHPLCGVFRCCTRYDAADPARSYGRRKACVNRRRDLDWPRDSSPEARQALRREAGAPRRRPRGRGRRLRRRHRAERLGQDDAAAHLRRARAAERGRAASSASGGPRSATSPTSRSSTAS